MQRAAGSRRRGRCRRREIVLRLRRLRSQGRSAWAVVGKPCLTMPRHRTPADRRTRALSVRIGVIAHTEAAGILGEMRLDRVRAREQRAVRLVVPAGGRDWHRSRLCLGGRRGARAALLLGRGGCCGRNCGGRSRVREGDGTTVTTLCQASRGRVHKCSGGADLGKSCRRRLWCCCVVIRCLLRKRNGGGGRLACTSTMSSTGFGRVSVDRNKKIK